MPSHNDLPPHMILLRLTLSSSLPSSTGWIQGNLPFGLLSLQESLQHTHNLLQTSQPRPQLSIDLLLVITQLDVEVFSVRHSSHGSTEDGLDEERMMRLEGCAVCVSEGGGQLVRWRGQVVVKSQQGELEAAVLRLRSDLIANMKNTVLDIVQGGWAHTGRARGDLP